MWQKRFCLWQHNSLTQQKIGGSTELISSSGRSSVSAGRGRWNCWASRAHIILLNSVASGYKQPSQSSRSYLTTSAPCCTTSQELNRKHKQNIDKTLLSQGDSLTEAAAKMWAWVSTGTGTILTVAQLQKDTSHSLKCSFLDEIRDTMICFPGNVLSRTRSHLSKTREVFDKYRCFDFHLTLFL